jgi:hypothetical protein
MGEAGFNILPSGTDPIVVRFGNWVTRNTLDGEGDGEAFHVISHTRTVWDFLTKVKG